MVTQSGYYGNTVMGLRVRKLSVHANWAGKAVYLNSCKHYIPFSMPTCQPWWHRHPIRKGHKYEHWCTHHKHTSIPSLILSMCSSVPESHKLPAMPVTIVKYSLSIKRADPLFSREKKWERRMETPLHWAELLTPSASGRERRMSRRVRQLGRNSNSLRECFTSALVKCVLEGGRVEKQTTSLWELGQEKSTWVALAKLKCKCLSLLSFVEWLLSNEWVNKVDC